MLCNIVNRHHSELKDHTTCVAQQINKNMSYLASLEHLELINLGEKGASFFENIYKMLPHKQLCWQTYAAAIIFGSHRPWITSLLRTEKFQGEVLKPLTASRRNTEKKNPAHFFALGVRQRFPTLTPEDIS